MSSTYFVVDHVSDALKTDGIVESYTMVPFQYEQDGQMITTMKRLNFVHWPELPIPFVHEEWSDSLRFTNIYIPEQDGGEDDEEDEDEVTEPVGAVDADGFDEDGNYFEEYDQNPPDEEEEEEQ